MDDNNEFSLVIVDLHTPEMDGFELLSNIKDDEMLEDMPVVIISSSESNEDIAKCL